MSADAMGGVSSGDVSSGELDKEWERLPSSMAYAVPGACPE